MKLTLQSDKCMSFALALLAVHTIMLMPTAAAAANPIADVLCEVVAWFHGPVGGGIATLAIIVVGIGALMGKVSWGMAMIVGLGVGVIFGAAEIVNLLSGDISSESCPV